MRKPWSDKDDARLRKGVAEKLSDSHLVAKFPGRTLDSVRRAIRRLGLTSKRKRPPRPPSPPKVRFIDITGGHYGRWTVQAVCRSTPRGYTYTCRCKCGTVKEVTGSRLRRGQSKSCGCLSREKAAKTMKALNARYTAGLLKTRCKVCGARVVMRKNNQKFCSATCAGRSRSGGGAKT
ncbi:MAG: hypothetical protein QM703_25445 [Gemmatales bacterium]